MADPLRILLVEDDSDDYLITSQLLQEVGGWSIQLEWLRTFEAARAAIAGQAHDVYLIDFRLGGHDGLQLVRTAVQQGCSGPLIVLTGQGNRAVDLAALKAGAADFLVKGQLSATTLERSIRYALERHRVREALQRAHRELEQRVQERTADLARANKDLALANRKDEFLAMLAHELRNPLAAISNAAQIVHSARVDAPAVVRASELMERQVRHMARLLDDLLDVSRITQSKIRLRTEPLDLTSVLTGAVQTNRALLEGRRHELALTLAPEPLWVEGDRTRLEQVLGNLLNNAIKYTPAGGRIAVTTERQGEHAVLRVRDTGVGISSELLPHVFDLFVQADNSMARSDGGLGIGLTLVRSLVELHGGQVSAASAGVGQGSEFTVSLPLSQMRPASAADRHGSPEGPQQRILVIEDHDAVRETLREVLEGLGHVVEVAPTGPVGLERIRQNPPDLALVDIGLPGMDGYEVARQVRSAPEGRRVYLVALTGYGRREDRERALAAGFHAHLVKPIDFQELTQLLDSRPG